MLQLPSFSGLLAFVMVGKKKSFRKAADEMLLTPGALSIKIKKLENQLGCKLFHRSRHCVTFTEIGQKYFDAIISPVMQIADATHRIFDNEQKSAIVVSVMSSFALRWLVPRLETFHRDRPHITVNINTSDQLVDFEADQVDLAIRHGLGLYPKLHAVRMFSEDIILVCNPNLSMGKTPLKELSDLRHHTLLHDNLAKDWGMLLTAMKMTGIRTDVGPRFNSDALMIQAAIEGYGVALAKMSLVKDEIDKGNLVTPFDIKFPSDFAYYVVYPKNRPLTPEAQIFRDWLITEACAYSESI